MARICHGVSKSDASNWRKTPWETPGRPSNFGAPNASGKPILETHKIQCCQQIVNNISIQTSHICLSSFPKKCPMLTQAHHPHIPCCDILGYYYYTIIVTKYEFKNQSHDLKVYQYQIRSSGILHYIHSISHLLGSDWDILVNTPTRPWLPSCNSMCFGMAWQRPVERKEGGRRPRPVSPRRATPRSVAGNHPLRMSMNEKDV